VILSLVTIVGLITMTGSSYLFAHADALFDRFAPFLKRFEHGYVSDGVFSSDNNYRVLIL
jgi:uncharacterized protein YxeA